MKMYRVLTFIVGMVLGSLLAKGWYYVAYSRDLCFDRKYQQALDDCLRTCVDMGKLPVETLTEAPGCYCADYEAIKLYPISKDGM